MIDIRKLERRLNIIRRDEGFIGGSLEVRALNKKGKNIEGKISHRHMHIEFNLNPNLDEIWKGDENIVRYCEAKKIDDGVEEVCKTVILHEIWHWKKEELTGKIGCPTDIIHNAKIMDSTFRALQSKRFFNDVEEGKREQYVKELSFMFDDILVNTNLAHENIHDGLAIVYYDMGKLVGEYHSLAEAFLKLQMNIYGRAEERKLISNFYTKDKEKKKGIDEVVEGILKDMDIKGLGLEVITSKFRDINTWEKLAYKFAYHMSDLINKTQDNSMSTDLTSSDKGDYWDSSSSNTNQVEKDNQEEDEENKTFQISPDYDLSRRDEEEIMAYYYSKEAGPPSFMNKKKVLKITYNNLADNIPIKAKTQERGFEMPLTPFRHEPFNVEEHDIQEVDFSKPVIDLESPSGESINFSVPSDSYKIVAPYSNKNERLPNLLWLVDCSGSMNDGSKRGLFNLSNTWKEDSKYHYALLGVFGSIKWLKSQRIAPYLKYNVCLFSDTTRASGWHGYHELENALDVCWNPEFGGTSIDMKVLSPELNVSPSVIIFMSDGGISNWSGIRDDFRSKVNKHLISYIQIKDETITGKDLKEWGREVYSVNEPSDLQGLIIDLTKQSYSKVLSL
ncbi:hypothetical protein HYX15_00095 [Candidatus Woesearchaeota archaeon]|nr:hypothetical protein [Candidatus Woesearchaeota archaeon]